MFFLFRFLQDPSHAKLQWALAAVLVALGVALIIWGLLDRSPLIAIRGAVELVVVGGFVLGVVRRHRRLSGVDGPNLRS